MTATLQRPRLAAMTDTELRRAYDAGEITLEALTAECDRRDRADKIRASSRERHSDWEAAARANYDAAEVFCRRDANMLSEAGKRTGRAPWPMLWQRSRAAIEYLCSDDLIVFWDYHQARPPSPGEYQAAERAAAAEQHAREDMPSPGMLAAIAAARGETAAPAPREPGSIARTITALGALTRTANQAARSLERVNGGIQR